MGTARLPIEHRLGILSRFIETKRRQASLGQRLKNQQSACRIALRSLLPHGFIRQIANASEFTPRNIQSPDERRFQMFGIKVRVPDPKNVFKSGMAAEVTVPLVSGE